MTHATSLVGGTASAPIQRPLQPDRRPAVRSAASGRLLHLPQCPTCGEQGAPQC